MKKIILISVALVLGAATTSFSIPVKDYNADNDVAGTDLIESIAPVNFTLNENAPVSFDALSGNSQLNAAGANNFAFTNWTPNWLNRPSWSNRPDWANFHYDLFSYFKKSKKYGRNGDVPASVPEPGTILLLGSGLIGLAYVSRKRMKS